MKRMVDLFSGLGGASQPFVDHPKWDVFRVEISELCSHVPHTIIADVMDDYLHLYLPSCIDLLWMSPPCTEFSLARHPRIENPDLTLVKRCLELVEILNPRYWVIENVKGSIKHLRPILGEPRTIIGGKFVLWGNFPLFSANIDNHSKMKNDSWSSDPLRPQKRAIVPPQIGEALRQSIDYQTTIDGFTSTRAKHRQLRQRQQ